MDVSVIIVNYNTFELTCKCINSVYQFTKEVSFEIILIDNASAECNAGLFLEKFPGIVLIKNTENVGFAKGNNTGIKLATGNSILLLNSDTELIEDSISMCCKKLEQLQDKVGIITCKLVYPNGDIQKQCYRFPSISLKLLELFRVHKLFRAKNRAQKFMGSYFDNCSDIMPDYVWGTFFMFKRDSLRKMVDGKLNEDYFMYYEDVRWCYDFSKQNKKCYYYSQTSIIHHLSQSLKHKSNKSRIIVHNELNFIARIHGRSYMALYGFSTSLNSLFSSFHIGKNYSLFYCYIQEVFKTLGGSNY